MNSVAIFDFDGVCRDESESYERCIRETVAYFDREKKEATEIELIESMKKCNDDWTRTHTILTERSVEKPFDKVKEHFQNLYLGKKRNFTGYINNEPWLANNNQLKELSSYFPLAIVSGAPAEEIQYTLKKNNALQYFTVILGMDDCEGKADGVRKVLHHFEAEKGYFCDDRPSPIKEVNTVPNIESYGILPPQNLENWEEVLLQSGAKKVFPNIKQYCEFLIRQLAVGHDPLL